MATPAEERFLDEALAWVSNRTVGILTIGQKQSESLGTATVAKLGDEVGLLTCAHVVKKLERQKEVGLVYFGYREKEKQFTRLSTKNLRLVRIGPSEIESDGPDLGFVGLPPEISSLLSAKLTVVEWEAEFRKASSPEPENTMNASFLTGLLKALDNTAPAVETPTERVFVHQARMNAGLIENKTKDGNGFDFFEFPIPAGTTDLPASFGATSGGPIWRFFTKIDDSGQIFIVENRLMGVAYYQFEGKEIRIKCHGPHSLHNVLLEKVKSRA